jgi:hypothetical protein
MTTLPLPFQFVAARLATWMARHQERVIDYLKEENRVRREKVGSVSPPRNDVASEATSEISATRLAADRATGGAHDPSRFNGRIRYAAMARKTPAMICVSMDADELLVERARDRGPV